MRPACAAGELGCISWGGCVHSCVCECVRVGWWVMGEGKRSEEGWREGEKKWMRDVVEEKETRETEGKCEGIER